MNLIDFSNNQESVLEKGGFKDTNSILNKGLAPNIPNNQGAYIIAFRHSKKITKEIEHFSRTLAVNFPSIIYDESNIHTTISTYGLTDNFTCDSALISILTESVKDTYKNLETPLVQYTGWLLNQNTGIATGTPNIGFINNISSIIENAKKKGIDLKMPWGSHITVSRFNCTPPTNDITNLLSYFSNAQPLGLSKLESIDVGYFNLSSKGFFFYTCERFNLK